MRAGEFPRADDSGHADRTIPMNRFQRSQAHAARPERTSHADTKPRRKAFGFITAYAERPHRSR
jgi:hypothetical protein